MLADRLARQIFAIDQGWPAPFKPRWDRAYLSWLEMLENVGSLAPAKQKRSGRKPEPL